MAMRPIARKEDLTICFAHVAYRMAERFAARGTGIKHFQVHSLDELTARVGEADVVSVSMMWRNELIAKAPKLALHPVDQRRHRPVRPRGAEGGRHPRRERAGRQRQCGLRARDGAHPRARPQDPHRARQPAQEILARHDLGHRAARGRARRQDAADRRPRHHRIAPRATREGVRHARDRRPSAMFPPAPARPTRWWRRISCSSASRKPTSSPSPVR